MADRAEAWALDGDGFRRLLAFLDDDPLAAGAKYEDIRLRLLKLFAWRGCACPDDCADRTFDRVARRLAEGAVVRSDDPYRYVHGVALNVAREAWRHASRSSRWLVALPAREPPAAGPDETDDDPVRSDRHLTCLDACLRELTPAHRELLLAYHAGDRHIERRRELAAALGVPVNALRIRVHRLRAAVEACVLRHLNRVP